MNARVWIPVSVLLLAAVAQAAGERDWYTRVKEDGLESACKVEVDRHARGVVKDSLHVGECYYRLSRWEEGSKVFQRLVTSPDRNYRAMARARLGEGYFHRKMPKEARETFLLCIEESPEAWLDGSVKDLCTAWLSKLDGKIPKSPPPRERVGVDEVRREVAALKKRLAELTELLKRLGEK